MTENQLDITKMELVDLYKLAFEQQKQATYLLAQIQQTQANLSALEAEIAKRVDEKRGGV